MGDAKTNRRRKAEKMGVMPIKKLLLTMAMCRGSMIVPKTDGGLLKTDSPFR